MSRRRIAYFYDSEIGNYYYGPGHPMKPQRARMVHNLTVAYGLHKKLEIYRPQPANREQLTMFHVDEYVDFLSKITPENMSEHIKALQRFNVGEDCPVFDGLGAYCQSYTSGSISAAAKLNVNDADIAVNWSGGMHHAKKDEASGFCYINDIVLCILELLKHHQRVLYIDIDIHHGDGVEEAFFKTDRVMCVSFHKFGDYFPGTGDIKDIGSGPGKHYSLNVPLNEGVTDETYLSIYKPVMKRVMEWYRPNAVVLQSGADSLAGDRLGCYNLSIHGHAACVEFIKRFQVPMVVLGGGGYTIRNVSRCWTYETAVLADTEVEDELPFNEYFEHYGPDYRLHLDITNMTNRNSREFLEKTFQECVELLRHLPSAPSVQMQNVPADLPLPDHREEEDMKDPDVRMSQGDIDRRVQCQEEFFDDGDAGEEEYADAAVDGDGDVAMGMGIAKDGGNNSVSVSNEPVVIELGRGRVQ